MFVIGTAGHVDHGKSSLVHALTGIDPDRLREEKERGLTIELGFAWLTLPSGREVSIVDVPGHERFIKNMLMGVGGVDVALLVVAADEGVMPQTREHMAIIDLLGIRPGVVAITKSDLADEDLVAIVADDIDELLEGTSLQGSPVVAVSAKDGSGLDELKRTLDAALGAAQAKRDLGRPRLPVDRSFTISGFGTVVTGTLTDGTLRTGQEVEILPGGKKARIRGVQSHEHAVAVASPGSRVAANLSGIDHVEINRGDVVTTPGWLTPSVTFDGSFRAVAGAPRAIRHNHQVTLFAGTFEVEATLRVLEGEQIAPGAEGWVQLKLGSPAPLVKGDHFIVRDSNDTLGGGRVLELTPRRHRRNDPAVIRRLESLATAGGENATLAVIERNEPATLSAISRAANTSEAEAKAAVAELVAAGLVVVVESAGIVYTSAGWQRLLAAADEVLRGFHAQYPLRPGMPREELRSRLGLKAADFAGIIQSLDAAKLVALDGSTVRLAAHTVRLTAAQEQEITRLKSALAANRFSPPAARIDPELMQLLIQRGEVVKAADDVVFLSDAYREMADGLIQHAEISGEISIDDVRSLYGTSRKYTLAVLEQMDRDNLTIRRGDTRVLRR